MSTPISATWDVFYEPGVNFVKQLRFKNNADGSPVNLRGMSALSQIWDRPRQNQYGALTVTFADRAQGLIEISKSAAELAPLPVGAWYDLVLTDSGGKRRYHIRGAFNQEDLSIDGGNPFTVFNEDDDYDGGTPTTVFALPDDDLDGGESDSIYV